MRAVIDLVRRWFRPRQPPVLPPESHGPAVLEFIGARQGVVGWASGRQEGLAALWEACPRADWLLDVARGAGLPFERLTRAARSLRLELGPGPWTTIDALLDDLTATLDHAVEGDPTYVERQQIGWAPDDLRNVLSEEEYFAALAARDELHRELHGRHARAVREAIPYREVRAALYGQVEGPYR